MDAVGNIGECWDRSIDGEGFDPYFLYCYETSAGCTE